jgi:hypothetical protein
MWSYRIISALCKDLIDTCWAASCWLLRTVRCYKLTSQPLGKCQSQLKPGQAGGDVARNRPQNPPVGKMAQWLPRQRASTVQAWEPQMSWELRWAASDDPSKRGRGVVAVELRTWHASGQGALLGICRSLVEPWPKG